ncbi:MAG: transcriptional regulator GcvA [SAR324 cluster bacterium]|nr:transcriptional regulator GcvA [SAR324 cluster bacterium]
MSYELPSLNGLRAFEAVARHLSFKNAARALFVTPGAVSQQIKGLEESLGKPLFRRLSRGIELTEAGQSLLPAVQEAFQRISEAAVRLTASDVHGPLTVSVLPSFAVRWLVPRLGRFRDLHPEFDVRISATTQLVDFAREDVDLAVRLGAGEWPGLHCVRLLAGDLFPVCSPKLLKGRRPLRRPEDLRHHTLLHNETYEEWPLWLRMHGVTQVDASRGTRFSDSGMVLQAAAAGQGVGLSRMALAEEDLEAGRLVKPFNLTVPSKLAYYICYPPQRENQPKITAFRDWLLDEASSAPHRNH